MEVLAVNLVDLLLHLDEHMKWAIGEYHMWVYLILFVIVFCETGLVVAPFLPGDSLLFAAGSFAGTGELDLQWVFGSLILAAILGDSCNYWIGRAVGPKVFRKEGVRLLNKKHLDQAHSFYQRHGGKTVAIARFFPILRTFAPFVAGIGRMYYGRFLTYSVLGTLCWVSTFVLVGFRFGREPFVSRHFPVLMMGIVAVSLLPAAIHFFRQRRRAAQPVQVGEADPPKP